LPARSGYFCSVSSIAAQPVGALSDRPPGIKSSIETVWETKAGWARHNTTYRLQKPRALQPVGSSFRPPLLSLLIRSTRSRKEGQASVEGDW
uniref:Secreted protein n=1 Tax=Gongylonema pulchrum TaxID=637853 RepID=A0A183DQ50_9BILA